MGPVIAVAAGVALIVFVFVDVALTTLHPSRRGALTAASRRLSWAVLSGRHGDERHRTRRTFAGPLALLLNIAAWVGGLWLGFALVYLPWGGDLSYSPSSDFGDRTFADALYFSGVALTTVGFGDVVGHSDALRLVSTIEAASGFGVISASVAYVLSITPLVRETRSSAGVASDLGLGDVSDVAALLAGGGRERLVSLHEAIVGLHHAIRRFPVLLYFVTADPRESPLVLLRAGAVAVAVLRWGVDPGKVPWARQEADALESAMRRALDAYGERFEAADAEDGSEPPVVEDLRAVVREEAPGLVAAPGTAAPGLPTFVERAQHALDRLGDVYGDPRRPLLAPRADA